MAWIDSWTRAPRRVSALVALACVAMLAFGMYLQHVVGLVPCPMCVVQRWALIFLAVFAGLASLRPGRRWWLAFAGLGVVTAALGAYTAARQSWLQWYPPEFATCGRDIYGMIEHFPIGRAIPMIFAGSGDCVAVDWTFLGGSIANWSFGGFVLLGLALLAAWLRLLRARDRHAVGDVARPVRAA